MYIFSRTRKARSDKLLEAMPKAVEIAGKVSQITGNDVHVWNVRFGQPSGTIMWSVRIESQAELFEATEKMMVDSSYHDMALTLDGLFEGPTTDQLVRVVSGTPADTPAKFVSSTQAAMASGHYTKAATFGVEMQGYVGESTGLATVFGTASYGGFGDVIWLIGAETMAEIDEAADWIASDTDYHARVDSAKDLFVEGSGHRGLIERLN